MPLYEYGCTKCKHIFELERKMADRKKRTKCPKCGSTSPELLVSRCDFSLKGGGWYASDYGVQSGKGKKKK